MVETYHTQHPYNAEKRTHVSNLHSCERSFEKSLSRANWCFRNCLLHNAVYTTPKTQSTCHALFVVFRIFF